MDARPAFATLLREYRLAAGLTQEDLADRSRMSVSAIGTLERGTHNAPQRHTVELLAAALELGPKARADLESIAARGRARKPRLKEAAGSGGQAALGLPLYLTSFVGRETELADARATLREHRLLTITGAGGTGKTRLAATIAAEFAPERVSFVELARVTNPQPLALQIASALGIPAQTDDAQDRIVEHLASEPALLVLDNCEHLVEAVAPLAVALLRAAPALRILATSRERLRVNGEHLLRLQPLPPEAALQLFVERAQALDPHFALQGSFVQAATDMCRRLDGIPLAIELAVARLPHLGLLELQRQLDRQLALPGANRDTPDRHQTMQTTIAWSFNLLNDRERSLLLTLAVFVGGFSLRAAEVVCSSDLLAADAVQVVLARLIDKSMLQVTLGNETARYHLLDSVRAYAIDRLTAEGRYDEAQRRHLDWILGLAQAAHEELQADSDLVISLAVRDDLDNVRAAVNRLTAVRGHATAVTAARIVGGLRATWISYGHFAEALHLVKLIEADLDAEQDPEVYGRLIWLKTQATRGEAQRLALADAIAFFRKVDDRHALATSYQHLLHLLVEWNDVEAIPPTVDEARAFFASSSTLAASLHVRFFATIARCEATIGNFTRARDDIALAFTPAVSPSSRTHAWRLFMAAEVEALAGNYSQASALCDQAIANGSSIGQAYQFGGRMQSAQYRLLAGDLEGSSRTLHEMVELLDEGYNDIEIPILNEVVAVAAAIAAERGFFDEAATLKGYVDTSDAVVHIGPLGKSLLERLEESLVTNIDPATYEAFRRAGAQLTNADATARALSIV
ncbi:MAG: helix-turn-helix domain-containing protein [Candidatus Cybelea sp.]